MNTRTYVSPSGQEVEIGQIDHVSMVISPLMTPGHILLNRQALEALRRVKQASQPVTLKSLFPGLKG